MAGAPMEKIIKAAVERGASDLHIKAGDVFRARIQGELVPLTKQRLTPDQTRAIASRLVATDVIRAQLDTLTDYDCSWGLPGVGRFRINILRQRSSFMIVMRVIPFAVPSIESLGLPPVVETLAEAEQGLVVVAGASGSGKSSTVAAIVNHINQNRQRHIVIIEDPIEFLHRDLTSSITQREVGVDTTSAGAGLRAALRQDPDVIVLGDLLDAESLDQAVKGAETGRLVISVMATGDVVSTVRQMLTMLPGVEREILRVRLAGALRGVLAQQLITRADGNGRAAVTEALVVTPAVRDLLQNPEGDPEDLADLMTGGEQGMMSYAQRAAELVADGVLSEEAAAPFGAAERRARSKGRSR